MRCDERDLLFALPPPPPLARLPFWSFLRQNIYLKQYIVRQGEAGEIFYMIARGSVDVLEVSVDPETGKLFGVTKRLKDANGIHQCYLVGPYD